MSSNIVCNYFDLPTRRVHKKKKKKFYSCKNTRTPEVPRNTYNYNTNKIIVNIYILTSLLRDRRCIQLIRTTNLPLVRLTKLINETT